MIIGDSRTPEGMQGTGRDKYKCKCKRMLSILYKSNHVLWATDTCVKIHDKSRKRRHG